MAKPYITVPRTRKTLEFYLKVIKSNLLEAYTRQFPEKNMEDLIEEIRHEKTSAHNLLKQLYNSEDNDTKLCIWIACAYWMESVQAYVLGQRELAWSCAMDAIFYSGSAKNSENVHNTLIPKLKEVFGDFALRKNAQKAGADRNKPFKKAGAKAVHLIKMRGERGERWKSYTAAAKSVLPQVKDIIEENNKRYTASDGGAKAIAGYLSKTPEIAPFILQKRGRPANEKAVKPSPISAPLTLLI